MAGTCRARERRRDRETDLRENSKRVERSTALVVEESLERNCLGSRPYMDMVECGLHNRTAREEAKLAVCRR